MMNVFSNLTLLDATEYRPVSADKNYLFKVVSYNVEWHSSIFTEYFLVLCKYN